MSKLFPPFNGGYVCKKGMTNARLWDQIVGGIFIVKEAWLEQESGFLLVLQGGGGDSYIWCQKGLELETISEQMRH